MTPLLPRVALRTGPLSFVRTRSFFSFLFFPAIIPDSLDVFRQPQFFPCSRPGSRRNSFPRARLLLIRLTSFLASRIGNLPFLPSSILRLNIGPLLPPLERFDTVDMETPTPPFQPASITPSDTPNVINVVSRCCELYIFTSTPSCDICTPTPLPL